MRRCLALLFVLAYAGSAQATGLLIPVEKKLPPLAMLNHNVDITIEDQVATTKIEQTFRNHTSADLEATYVFPIPKGASVRKFSMWIGGKETPGELVEAEQARKMYTEVLSRTMNPGLLEYMNSSLLKLRVFPVPAKGDLKIAVSYTSLAVADNGLIEYVYPLKTDNKAASTLEKFTLNVSLKSQHPLQNIYSPSHAITTSRPNDRTAVIGFEKDAAVLDRDFQLYYSSNTKDVGLTALAHRPNPSGNGYFMLLVSPRAELSKTQQVPRDMVFVLDTSGSMRGPREAQARNALKYCLKNLTEKDRFALVTFATTVNKYSDKLQDGHGDNVEAARKWVEGLEFTGGTNIDDALAAALAMRSDDEGRTFTIVFFTDGRPTIGETNADKILANVAKRNTANTRIFTFGVGDDVNAALLDQLADKSRALSTYVRETEDIEVKVSSLYSKISNPVLANLKLTVGEGVQLNEVYPPQLPDLFHGSQLVVLGRYTGKGHAAVKLSGTVGKEAKEFVYEINFVEKSAVADEKPFVEDLWARRKVGYLLDQIRINGEKDELVKEVVALAKRYGITTPYTSYLLVPDGPLNPVAKAPVKEGRPDVRLNPQPPAALQPGKPGEGAIKLEDFAKKLQTSNKGKGGFGSSRIGWTERELKEAQEKAKEKGKEDPKGAKAAEDGLYLLQSLDDARRHFNQKDLDKMQNGQLAVDFAVQNNYLRSQDRTCRVASRMVQNRNCLEIGGVWIDDKFDAKAPTVTIKAMSKAYFRLLERQPAMRDVCQLGNHVIWVSPSGTALIIDQGAGREEMDDADLDRLFVAPKPAKK